MGQKALAMFGHDHWNVLRVVVAELSWVPMRGTSGSDDGICLIGK